MQPTLRLNKVLAAAILIAIALSVVFIAPEVVSRFQDYRAAQLRPRPANDPEQLEILRDLLRLNDYYGLPTPSPPQARSESLGEEPAPTNWSPTPTQPGYIVLIDSSVVSCVEGLPESNFNDAYEGPCLDEQTITSLYDDPRIPKKLRREFIAANRRASVIPKLRSARVVYRSKADIYKFFSEANGWDQFAASFPHSYGFIEVSRAVLSDDGSHALIFVVHNCGRLCGTGVFYYLTRTGKSWRIEVSSQIWIS